MAKKSNVRLFIILGAIAVVLIIAAVLAGGNKERGEKVTTSEAQRRTLSETVTGSGKIFPEVEVIISSDVSGEIIDLQVQEGDTVTMGQLLLRVDPEVLESTVERSTASVNNARAQLANSRAQIQGMEASLQQAEAGKAQIEAQLTQARQVNTRNESLYKEGVISLADLEASQANLRGLEANLRSAEATIASTKANIESARQQARAAEFNVASAQASLKEQRTNLSRASIYAPMSGIVSKVNLKEGERVVGTGMMNGTEILRIADFGSMEVQVDISENDIVRVDVGDPVEVEVDAFMGRKFDGKVSQIASSASNIGTAGAALTSDQVTNFIVKIRIDRASYDDLIQERKTVPFRPGMSATVDIMTQERPDVVTVPIQAVTTRDKEDLKKGKGIAVSDDDLLEVVFVVVGDTVTQRTVTTGIQDDTYIEITSGLEAGATVVEGPYRTVSSKLESGDRVVAEQKETL